MLSAFSTSKANYGVLLIGLLSSAIVAPPTLAVAPAGGFLVHLGQQANFSDSRRSVTFYATDDIGGGPIFSVHLPGEIINPGSYNYEELSAIAADPMTGDVYVLAYDSGDVGGVESSASAPDDTEGDLDLYRINFALAYDHWSENFQGTIAAGSAGVGGRRRPC